MEHDGTSLPFGATILLGESLALEEIGETADRFLATRDDGSRLSKSLPYFLSTWGSRDPLAATRWFLSKDIKDFDEQQVTRALEMAALKDPSRGAGIAQPRTRGATAASQGRRSGLVGMDR